VTGFSLPAWTGRSAPPPGEDSERALSLTDAWAALVRIRNRSMTQTELAERAGLHRSAVSKMEAVGYLPTLRTMATYADALDIELNLTLRKKAS